MENNSRFVAWITADERRDIKIYRYYLKYCSFCYRLVALLLLGYGLFVFFTMATERHPLFILAFFLRLVRLVVFYAVIRWGYVYLTPYNHYPISRRDDYRITICKDRLTMQAEGKREITCMFCPSWPKNKPPKGKEMGPFVITVHECESGLYFSMPLVFGPLAFVSKEKFSIQDYNRLKEMLRKAFGAKYRQV